MRIVLIVITSLLVSASAFANNPLDDAAEKATSADQLLTLGNLNLEANRDKEARNFYKAAELRLKNTVEAKFGLAQIRVQNGDLRQAKQACRKLEKEFPKSPVAKLCFGRMWLKFERSARAIENFEAVKDSGDIRAILGLAKTYDYMNEYEKSIALYREAIEKGADYEADLGLGLILERKGDSTGALEAVQNAVKKENNSALAQFHLGRLMKTGKQAAEHINIALQIRPDWADAYGTLGSIYLESDLEQAVEAYKKAIELEPDRDAFHLGLGTAYFRQKKYDDARAELDKALSLVPNHIGATQMLAELELATGNNSRAVTLAEKAVQLSPNDPIICYNTAYLFFQMKRYTQANAYFLRTIAMDPKSSASFAHMGDIACERRMYKDGIKHYQDALKGDLKGMKKSDVEKRIKQCKP
ncbi:MAG: tetratricopeptide repeat protein [Deltaproteobacteria bacterium]|nr:tetratricopeptide repeat protein [Deltaproteobacteria bacterium]MBN2670631.1 tetratricopeptide repeat protein [Deltaproteobacteria bacterium]